MRTVTLEQFQAELLAQKVPRDHLAVKCPMCKTVQSAADLIADGAGASFEDVERFLGYSCVGRWKDKHARGPGKGCDWTLGGFLQLHKLVIVADGKRHPHFEPATPAEAQTHFAAKGAGA